MAEPAPAPAPAPAPRAASASVKLSDSMCAPQYAASLKCLDEANYDKSKCQDYFDAYKECKKQERHYVLGDLGLPYTGGYVLAIRRENYVLKPTGNLKGSFEVLPKLDGAQSRSPSALVLISNGNSLQRPHSKLQKNRESAHVTGSFFCNFKL